MRLYSVLLACLLLSPLRTAKAADVCAAATLPTGVQQLLQRNYSDWRPKTMADLESDDQKLWISTNPHSCPGIAIGHFEQPNQIAYALLLVPKSDAKSGYALVVAARTTAANDYQLKVLDHANGPTDSGLVISKQPPGKYSGFDDPKSVNLKLNGLNLQWLEKASVLYFYSNGEYQQLQTSD